VYASAIRASAVSCPVILSTNAYQLDGSLSLAELMRTRETPAVMAEFAKITPETHAKYLLTSGSTGRPKIAINTHRMLCANQKQIQQSWPFLKEEKPVIVSWLPWSHTFGANHNFNLVLCNGGSFYIDEGRPVPGLMEKSVRNLREVQPNLYFNVPRGFDALIAFLEQDESFARTSSGACGQCSTPRRPCPSPPGTAWRGPPRRCSAKRSGSPPPGAPPNLPCSPTCTGASTGRAASACRWPAPPSSSCPMGTSWRCASRAAGLPRLPQQPGEDRRSLR
jgi:hypothetical protein